MQEAATFGGEVTLVQKPGVIEEGSKISPEQEYLARLALSQTKILKLLPIAKIALTENEQQAAQTYQLAHLILGPAAAAPMVCSKKCPAPFRTVCPLAKAGKEPVGQRCPSDVSGRASEPPSDPRGQATSMRMHASERARSP